MIYDELTRRDLYMYRRGEMREYIRNYMKEHGSQFDVTSLQEYYG